MEHEINRNAGKKVKVLEEARLEAWRNRVRNVGRKFRKRECQKEEKV